MKKELENKINKAFANFPLVDRLWVNDKTGEVYFDYTHEIGLKEVKREESSVAATLSVTDNNKVD